MLKAWLSVLRLLVVIVGLRWLRLRVVLCWTMTERGAADPTGATVGLETLLATSARGEAAVASMSETPFLHELGMGRHSREGAEDEKGEYDDDD